MKISERVAALDAAQNVLAAYTRGEVEAIGGNLHAVRVEWVVTSGDVVNNYAARLIVDDFGLETEAAYWQGELPGPLRPAPVETKYLTMRTAGGWAALTAAAQRTAIENFCNDVYKAKVANARNIRDFSVEPWDGSTVKVSGWFNTGASLDEWRRRAWFIRLIDPNGSVAAGSGNVEFHEVIE